MAHATVAENVPGLQARRWPRVVAWLVAGCLCAGCTTLQSKQLPPEALQAQIRNGSVVQTGDEVSIVTKDGEEHTFRVAAVGTDAITGTLDGGASVTVPIDDVLSLRTREISLGRTALAVAGVYLFVALVEVSTAGVEFYDALYDLITP